MIEVKDLNKSYGTRKAIENLNFSVAKGEVVGFLGPNGAGKSTTMKIITGFMAPTSGQATIGGIDVFENPIAVKKKIGYLPETPPVYGDMFVKDYLKYVAKLKAVEGSKIDSMVDYAIRKTNLADVKGRLIQNLSKGFRQRVGIAQALVSDPEVLILDEPTVGLDPVQVAEIRELIKELRGKHTIILSTHILPEVQAICEKVIIINKGRIVAKDTIENLSSMESQTGKSALTVRVRKETNLASYLATEAGILNVERGQGAGLEGRWVINYNGGEETIDAISAKIVQGGFGLLELTPTKVDLEDIFLKLTYGESQAAGAKPSATHATSSASAGAPFSN